MIYIIAGASGCGKKYVLEQMKRMRMDLVEIKKKTTKPYPHDPKFIKNDLEYGISEADIDQQCEGYVYTYEGYKYGIDIQIIDQVLMMGKSPIIIVRDYDTIRKLKEIYYFSVVIYVHTALTGETLKTRFAELKISDELTPEQRLEREAEEYKSLRDAINDGLQIDGYIANNFYQTINLQIRNILLKVQEIDYHRIFIAMPFTTIKEVYHEKFVKGALTTLKNNLNLKFKTNKFIVGRADELEVGYFTTYSIHERIDSQIKKSYIVICDLSLNNPNVSFEYEEAIGNNKIVITIAREGSYGAKFRTKEIDVFYNNDESALVKALLEKICSFYLHSSNKINFN